MARARLALPASVVLVLACAETGPASLPEATVRSDVIATASRLELGVVRGPASCQSPYPLVQLSATLVAGDGQRYCTPRNFDEQGRPGPRPGALDPAQLSTRTTFGSFSPDLLYVPPADVLPMIGAELVVEARLTNRPQIQAQLTLPPVYDCPQFVNLAGRTGQMGVNGIPGRNGEPGPAVQVAIGYVTSPRGELLILVRVDGAGGLLSRTLLRPTAPPLQIFLDGGTGGMGSATERLWTYGTRPTNLPPSPGGDGGDGGSAEIVYDEASPELESRVAIINRGGGGGYGEGGTGRPGRPGAIPRVSRAPSGALFRDEIAHGFNIRRSKSEATSAHAI